MKPSLTNLVLAVVLVATGLAVGAAGVIVGEVDDAPGAALIGLLMMIGIVGLGIWTGMRKS